MASTKIVQTIESSGSLVGVFPGLTSYIIWDSLLVSRHPFAFPTWISLNFFLNLKGKLLVCVCEAACYGSYITLMLINHLHLSFNIRVLHHSFSDLSFNVHLFCDGIARNKLSSDECCGLYGFGLLFEQLCRQCLLGKHTPT